MNPTEWRNLRLIADGDRRRRPGAPGGLRHHRGVGHEPQDGRHGLLARAGPGRRARLRGAAVNGDVARPGRQAAELVPDVHPADHATSPIRTRSSRPPATPRRSDDGRRDSHSRVLRPRGRDGVSRRDGRHRTTSHEAIGAHRVEPARSRRAAHPPPTRSKARTATAPATEENYLGEEPPEPPEEEEPEQPPFEASEEQTEFAAEQAELVPATAPVGVASGAEVEGSQTTRARRKSDKPEKKESRSRKAEAPGQRKKPDEG